MARNLNLTRIVKSSSCNQCFTYKLGKFLCFAYNTEIFHKRQYCKFTDNGSKIPRNIFSKENWLSCNLVEKHHEICHQYSNISITYSCKDLWYYNIPQFSRKMMAKFILYAYHTSKKVNWYNEHLKIISYKVQLLKQLVACLSAVKFLIIKIYLWHISVTKNEKKFFNNRNNT